MSSNFFLFCATLLGFWAVDRISIVVGVLLFGVLSYFGVAHSLRCQAEADSTEVERPNKRHEYVRRISAVLVDIARSVPWQNLFDTALRFWRRSNAPSSNDTTIPNDQPSPEPETSNNYCGTSPSVDNELRTMINCITRDYIESWYHKNVSEDEEFVNDVRRIMEHTFNKLSIALGEVNKQELLSCVLQIYLHYFRHFKSALGKVSDGDAILNSCLARKGEVANTFEMFHWATVDHMTEWCYLQSIMATLLNAFGPSDLQSCPILQNAVTEILTQNVMFPLVTVLADPNRLNMWILKLLQTAFGVECDLIYPIAQTAQSVQQDSSPVKDTEDHLEQPTISLTKEDGANAACDDSSCEELSASSNCSMKMNSSSGKSTDISRESLECSKHSTENSGGDAHNCSCASGCGDACSKHSMLLPTSFSEYSNLSEPAAGDMQKEAKAHEPLSAEMSQMKRSKSADYIRHMADVKNTVPASPSSLRLLRGSYKGSLTSKSSVVPQLSVEMPEEDLEVPPLFEDIKIVGTQLQEEFGHNPYTLYCIEYKGLFRDVSSDVSPPPLVREVVQIKRRFREFHALHSRLDSNPYIKPHLKGIKGPTKRFITPFANLDKKNIAERQVFLESYLQELCKRPVIAQSNEMQEFLAYGGDARIAFVQKPFISLPRLDKIISRSMRSAIDLIRTALPVAALDNVPPHRVKSRSGSINAEERVTDDVEFPVYVLGYSKQDPEVSACIVSSCNHFDSTSSTESFQDDFSDVYDPGPSTQHLPVPQNVDTYELESCSCSSTASFDDISKNRDILAHGVIDIVVASLFKPHHEPSPLLINLLRFLPTSLINTFLEQKLEGITEVKCAGWLHTFHRTMWPEGPRAPKAAINSDFPILLSDFLKSRITAVSTSSRCSSIFVESILELQNVLDAIELLLGSLQNETLNRCVLFHAFDEVIKIVCGKCDSRNLA